jgi:hypothetical protein
MARTANVRLIVSDRPGIGLLQFKPGRKVTDWPDDVMELADQLEIGRFSVLGVSGRCPYSLVCAMRIASVGIVSGIGPHHIHGLTDGANPNNLHVLRMSLERPAAFRPILWSLGVISRVAPRYMAIQAASAFPPVDQQLLHQHDFAGGLGPMFEKR